MHCVRLGNVIHSFCEHGFPLHHEEASVFLLFIHHVSCIWAYLYRDANKKEGQKEQIPPGTKTSKMKGDMLKDRYLASR
jgi:hypothetical protein